MKKLYFLSYMLLPILQFCSDQASTNQQFHDGAHHHHYHNQVTQVFSPSPTFNNNNHNGSNAQGGSNQTSVQQSTNQQNVISQQLRNLYKQAQELAPSYLDSLFTNKRKIILGTLALGYMYIRYTLHKVHNLLKNHHSWCNWKQVVSTQHLLSTPYQDLIPELLNDIQKKYFLKIDLTKNQEATTFSTEQFAHDIQHELVALNHYLSLQKLIKTFWLSLLFGRLYSKQMIKEKINRLQIILDIFVTWQTQGLIYKKEIE